jgi:subtilisin
VLPWGVGRIDAEWAWNSSRGSEIKVAVVDTGIDADHPDLVANLEGGVNFVSKPWWKPADPNRWDDDNGHGTHVAGIIAAADNKIGVIGVAPEASLYAVKVLDQSGSGYVSSIIAGID